MFTAQYSFCYNALIDFLLNNLGQFFLLEKIAWDKAAWSEAAKTDPDFLNLGKSKCMHLKKLFQVYCFCFFSFSPHLYR
jgi:hypothetical protein